MKRIVIFIIPLVLVIFTPIFAGSLQYSIFGKPISSIQLKNGNDEPKSIPFVGEKVLTIFYTDPDVKDVNDPLSQAIAKKKYSLVNYCAIGIGNCSDTWFPNAAIRYKTRQKEEQYPLSVILLDDAYIVKKAWSLVDCDDAAIVMIVGKDKIVKYVKAVKTQEESIAIAPEVLKILDRELNK